MGTYYFDRRNENIKRHLMKKIWIDLDNSPHVLFFNPIIKELNKRSVDVLVTARDFAQVIELLDLFQIKHITVGKHYGKNTIMKIIGIIVRALQLIPIVFKRRPDFAISHGSRSQFLVAKLLGIKVGVALDYEFIKMFPLLTADIVFIPKMISKERVTLRHKQIYQYNGIKENIYVPSFRPSNNPEIQNYFNSISQNIIITIRPPATLAHYYTKKSKDLFEYLLKYLSTLTNIKVIFVPRTKDQENEIKQVWQNQFISGRFSFLCFVLNGLDLIWNSDLVISGGGTMIREATAVNVPAYSTLCSQIGAVDRYLESTGKLVILRNENDIQRKIIFKKRKINIEDLSPNDSVLNELVNKIINMI